MDRKQRELVAAKRIGQMKDCYDKGSKALPKLEVGDKVHVQNQTTIRTTKWDGTGIITAILGDRKYEIMMDGSRRITVRNRRHLRKIPRKVVEEEEEDEDEDVISIPSVPVPGTSVPVPVPETSVPVPAPEQVKTPAPEQVKVREPVPTSVPAPGSSPARDSSPAPTLRRSSREKTVPDRLELTTKGKTYAKAVVYGLKMVGVGGGKKDVSERDVRLGREGHAGYRHSEGQPQKVAYHLSRRVCN